MKIILNGQEKHLEVSITISALLREMALAGKRVAVEVNQEIVPRSRHGEYQLVDNDRVEIVRAIGGGTWQQPYRR